MAKSKYLLTTLASKRGSHYEIEFTFNGSQYWERVEEAGLYGITRIANGVVVFEKAEAVNKAANHFLDLYADEIKEDPDQISRDMVFEWWVATKDQYPGVKELDVEKVIFNGIPFTA